MWSIAEAGFGTVGEKILHTHLNREENNHGDQLLYLWLLCFCSGIFEHASRPQSLAASRINKCFVCYKALPSTVRASASGGCLPIAVLDSPLLSIVNGIGLCKEERPRLLWK